MVKDPWRRVADADASFRDFTRTSAADASSCEAPWPEPGQPLYQPQPRCDLPIDKILWKSRRTRDKVRLLLWGWTMFLVILFLAIATGVACLVYQCDMGAGRPELPIIRPI